MVSGSVVKSDNIPCRICASSATTYLFQAPLEKYTAALGKDVGVTYHHCEKCSGLFQHPIFTESQYKEFYESIQRSEQTGYHSQRVPQRHIRKKQRDTAFKWKQLRLLDVEGTLPGKRVFEIGPGEGTLLASFRDRGFSVRGVEPLDLYAVYAREVFGLDVTTGYFNAGVVESNSADLIILDNVLEHLVEPMETLRLAWKMLEPAGLLYLAVPCAETPTAANANIAHITLWTRRALAFVLRCAGFELLAMIQGRPAGRPHEWVCLSQACGNVQDVEQATPHLFCPIDRQELSRRWHEHFRQIEQSRRRRERLGIAYPILAYGARSLRRMRRLIQRSD